MVENQKTGCKTTSDSFAIHLQTLVPPNIKTKKAQGILWILYIENQLNSYQKYLWKRADGREIDKGIETNNQFINLVGETQNGIYKVQITDVNNCVLETENIQVDITSRTAIVPNINQGVFKLLLNNPEIGPVQIGIYNTNGQKLKTISSYKYNSNQTIEIEANDLQQGNYLLNINMTNFQTSEAFVVRTN